MTEIKIFCPNCGQHIQCDDTYRGTQISCPSCKQGFVVPVIQEAAAPLQASPDAVLRALEQDVANSIKETIPAFVVQSVSLVHSDGVKYKGTVSGMTAQGIVQQSVEVSFDGANIVWQLSEKEPSSAGIRVLGLFLIILSLWMNFGRGQGNGLVAYGFWSFLLNVGCFGLFFGNPKTAARFFMGLAVALIVAIGVSLLKVG